MQDIFANPARPKTPPHPPKKTPLAPPFPHPPPDTKKAPAKRSMINKMEQVTGIEPALKAWEALILPLNYTCIQTAARRQRRKHEKIYSRPPKILQDIFSACAYFFNRCRRNTNAPPEKQTCRTPPHTTMKSFLINKQWARRVPVLEVNLRPRCTK